MVIFMKLVGIIFCFSCRKLPAGNKFPPLISNLFPVKVFLDKEDKFFCVAQKVKLFLCLI